MARPKTGPWKRGNNYASKLYAVYNMSELTYRECEDLNLYYAGSPPVQRTPGLFEKGKAMDRDPISMVFWEACAALDAARAFIDSGDHDAAIGRTHKVEASMGALRKAIKTLAKAATK